MGISIFTIAPIISIGILLCFLINSKSVFFGVSLVGLCAVDVFIKALFYSPLCLGVSILLLALSGIRLGIIIAIKGKAK